VKSRRLPLATTPEPRAAETPDPDRPACPVRTVGVIGARPDLDAVRFAAALVGGAVGAPAVLVVTRAGPGPSREVTDPAEVASPDAARTLEAAGAAGVRYLRTGEDAAAAVGASLSALAGAPWVVAVGVEVALHLRPWLLVLLTGGLPPQAWDPAVRGLAPEAALVLSEPRAGVARGIASRAAR